MEKNKKQPHVIKVKDQYKCSECLNDVQEYPQQNSPDDYDVIPQCKHCGFLEL